LLHRLLQRDVGPDLRVELARESLLRVGEQRLLLTR
jgi:hypothetical protein